MAEVQLTFDNSDGRAPAEYAEYSEIQIGRRLYRSGESEYSINKTVCRLKDVVDFFLGTGVGTKAYSVVEQGMIGAIITSKPEDRRAFLEEAAGISKFKSRKESAGLKKYLWGGALWERGYFVMSSGKGTTDEMVRKYIREQRGE